jgi:hypothetical protein
LTGDLARDGDHVDIRDLEMLKGIRGLGSGDVHRIPVTTLGGKSSPAPTNS